MVALRRFHPGSEFSSSGATYYEGTAMTTKLLMLALLIAVLVYPAVGSYFASKTARWR